MSTKQDAVSFIRGCSTEELDELARVLNARRDVLDTVAMETFNIGDRVWFDSGRRGRIEGVVSGFTRHKVVVDAGRLTTRWQVAGSVLRRLPTR